MGDSVADVSCSFHGFFEDAEVAATRHKHVQEMSCLAVAGCAPSLGRRPQVRLSNISSLSLSIVRTIESLSRLSQFSSFGCLSQARIFAVCDGLTYNHHSPIRKGSLLDHIAETLGGYAACSSRASNKLPGPTATRGATSVQSPNAYPGRSGGVPVQKICSG